MGLLQSTCGYVWEIILSHSCALNIHWIFINERLIFRYITECFLKTVTYFRSFKAFLALLYLCLFSDKCWPGSPALWRIGSASMDSCKILWVLLSSSSSSSGMLNSSNALVSSSTTSSGTAERSESRDCSLSDGMDDKVGCWLSSSSVNCNVWSVKFT